MTGEAEEDGEPETFHGVPLDDIPIETVEWTPSSAEHIRTRSERVRPTEFDVEPEWATEAAVDPDRLVAIGSPQSIEVVGLSRSAPRRHPEDAGRVLKVWLHPKGAVGDGDWWGASASDGNREDRRDYYAVEGNEES